MAGAGMRAVRATLRRHFPIKRRVVVTIDQLEADFGSCWMEGDTIRISVRESDQRGEMAHTLVHEWAHARIFDRAGRSCRRHSVAWAREYAAMYDRIFGND